MTTRAGTRSRSLVQETVSTNEYEFLPAGTGRFINNTVYFDGQVGVGVNVGADTDPGSFTIATNRWYSYDDPRASDPPVDPLFADAAAGDFHIHPASPAATAGIPLAELGCDYEGKCFADPPSIGALEL